jgi:transmembrane sensor
MGDRKKKLRVQLSFERFDRGQTSLNLRAVWESATRGGRRHRRLSAKLMAALIFLLVPTRHSLLQLDRWQTFQADTARSVVLQDGSKVLLNENSELRARFTRNARELLLMRGGAFFSVAHNRGWPFRVAAGDTIVEAVGTAFTVQRVTAARVDIVVTQGRVAITHPVRNSTESESMGLQTAIVSAGSEFDVDGQTDTTGKLAVRELVARLAWTAESLALRNRPLGEVVREINRYNQMRLEITTPALEEAVIGGSVNATDPEGFIKKLPQIYHISTARERREDGSVVIRLSPAQHAGSDH